MNFEETLIRKLRQYTPSQLPKLNSPASLLIIITSTFFVSDAIVMFLHAWFPPLPLAILSLVDSVLVIALLSPVLYNFIFKQSRMRIIQLLKTNEELQTQITDRKRAEEALQKSEEQHRLLIETMNEGLAVIDENGLWTYVNDKLCERLGYPRDEIIGHPVTDFLDEKNQKLFKEQKEKRMTGRYGSYEMSYLRKDGQRIFAIISPRPIFDRDGQFKGSFAVITDITERKRAEEALRESEKQLRSLSSQLLTAQEAERRRLSGELHDELGQGLTVIKLQLSRIERNLRRDQGSLLEDCKYTLQYIDRVIENVRHLSRDLSPFVLEDLGLPAALRWMVDEFNKHYHVQVSLGLPETDHLLPRETQIIIYRILQETLTNIGKHAQATHVSIAIQRENGTFYFKVEDDGKGFDMNQYEVRKVTEKGLGLTTMKERIRMLGGSLDIWSRKEEGTRITFKIPLEKGETP